MIRLLNWGCRCRSRGVGTMKKRILNIATIVSAIAWMTGGSAALYAQNTQQAEAGRALYGARCATCHGVDLGGSEAPQLSGANFMAAWGTRSSRELITYIQSSMPPGTNKLG